MKAIFFAMVTLAAASGDDGARLAALRFTGGEDGMTYTVRAFSRPLKLMTDAGGKVLKLFGVP